MTEWIVKLSKCLLPFNPAPKGGDNWAGVATILTKDAEVLLVKRAERTSDPWSGDWAMPGGKWNVNDVNLYDTIRREVMEETSIDLSQLVPIGWLPLRSPNIRPELKIMPLVLLTSNKPHVVINEELKDYRWVALSKLVFERRYMKIMRGEVLADVYSMNNNIIWGITARIIQEILSCIELRLSVE